MKEKRYVSKRIEDMVKNNGNYIKHISGDDSWSDVAVPSKKSIIINDNFYTQHSTGVRLLHEFVHIKYKNNKKVFCVLFFPLVFASWVLSKINKDKQVVNRFDEKIAKIVGKFMYVIILAKETTKLKLRKIIFIFGAILNTILFGTLAINTPTPTFNDADIKRATIVDVFNLIESSIFQFYGTEANAKMFIVSFILGFVIPIGVGVLLYWYAHTKYIFEKL